MNNIDLNKPITTGSWLPDEDEILKKHYPHTTCAGVAWMLNRHEKSVYDRAQLLGIGKSEAFLKSNLSGRINGNVGIQTRFKMGHLKNKHELRMGFESC